MKIVTNVDYTYTKDFTNDTNIPIKWDDILNGPCYVINLNRNTDRWDTAKIKVKAAGFKNITRIEGVDGKNEEQLIENWKIFGNPKFARWDEEFVKYPGKQGCFLSHMKIWKEIIDNKIPWAVIFEDDVIFHDLWDTLAPAYYNNTPKDFDVLYFGSQFEFNSKYSIDKGPVFCTHSMLVSYEGAKKMYEMCLNKTDGVYTIDYMLIDMMKYKMYYNPQNNIEFPFNWYVWNGINFFPSKLVHIPKGWSKRNSGLVFQDESYGSEVRPW